MYIYKITNTINNKVYIGQTIRPIKDRFNRHISDSLNNIIDTHFARAIRKYGADKFDIELIDNATDQNELTLKEQYWIRYYNSNNSKYGYNETDALYKCGGNTYQGKTPEEMENISKKLSKSKSGGLNPKSRKVKCFNVNTKEEIIFDSFSLCQKYFNEKHHRFITNRALHRTRSLYKNEWAIAYYEDKYFDFVKTNYNPTKKRYLLSVIDIYTNIKTEFSSIKQMCSTLGLKRSRVSKLIKEKKNFIIDRYNISVLS
jgi:group I intron endonuclease